MPSKLPIITFRLSQEDNKKFKYIAELHNRKINDELKMITKKYIADFETENGEIIVGEDGRVTIAKPVPILEDESSDSKTG